MDYYENNFIEKIRNKADIVSLISDFISIKKRGRNFIALCPFHNEKTPSFVISPEKQIYHCFGCGVNGDIFSFLMKHEKMTFKEAIIYLSKKFLIEIEESKYLNKNNYLNKKKEKNKEYNILYEIHCIAARYFYKKLYSEKGRDAFKYINKRKLNKKTLNIFKVGYAPYNNYELIEELKKLYYNETNLLNSGIFGKNEKNNIYLKFYNRLIFPIENIKGKIIAFGGRSINDESEIKYLNSKETYIFKKKNNLFGLNNSLQEIKKLNQTILVEGYIDVLTIWQKGIKNVVSSLGTAFTEEQGRLLSRYCNEIVIIFDNDEAGKKAVLKALEILKNFKIDIKIVNLEEAKDPDEFLNKFGLNNFLRKIRDAKTGFRYLLDNYKNIYNYKLPEEKIKCIRKILPYIMSFEDNLLKNEYLKILSEELNINFNELSEIVYLGKNSIDKKKYNNKISNKKNEKKEVFQDSQLIALKLFLNYFEYSDLFTNSILESFTDFKINKIISFIISLKNEEKRVDIILSKLKEKKEEEISSFLSSISFESNLFFPNMKKEEFHSYLLVVRKNYLKKKLNEIIEKIKIKEKEKKFTDIENLKKQYFSLNNEIIEIVKLLKEKKHVKDKKEKF